MLLNRVARFVLHHVPDIERIGSQEAARSRALCLGCRGTKTNYVWAHLHHRKN